MQVKHLIKHGNSLALVIDKAHLNSANLNENTLFHIVSDSTGITIQSVEPADEKSFEEFEESLKHILKKYSKALTDLSHR